VRLLERVREHDISGAEQVLANAREDGADAQRVRLASSFIAVMRGRTEEGRRLVAEAERVTGLWAGELMMVAMAAIQLGDLDAAPRLYGRKSVQILAPIMLRLDPELHPLLDVAPFAPRRSELTLVWPLEAAMIGPAQFTLFKEVRIESGIPQASELTKSSR